MPEIKVTFGALEAARTDVAATAARITGQLEDLRRFLAPLVATWEGEAAAQYQAAQRQMGHRGCRPRRPCWPRSAWRSARPTTATGRSSRPTPPAGGSWPVLPAGSRRSRGRFDPAPNGGYPRSSTCGGWRSAVAPAVRTARRPGPAPIAPMHERQLTGRHPSASTRQRRGRSVPTYSPKPGEITRAWHVIDATDVVLGRLATHAATLLRGKHKPTYAPHMDTGDFVVIVNAEKIAVSGNKRDRQVRLPAQRLPGRAAQALGRRDDREAPRPPRREGGQGHAAEEPPRPGDGQEAQGLRRAATPARRAAAR